MVVTNVTEELDLTFRKVEPNDIQKIYNIEKRVFASPWSKSQFFFELVSEVSVPILAEYNGRIIGYAFSFFVVDEGSIANIAIDTPYQGRGFGEKLMDEVLKILTEKGAKNIFLEVRKSNFVAISLYKKKGFFRIGERKKYYRNGEDAIIMVKDIDV